MAFAAMSCNTVWLLKALPQNSQWESQRQPLSLHACAGANSGMPSGRQVNPQISHLNQGEKSEGRCLSPS